ncbi:Protein FMP42 [Porphyridium purpureum]|uniref:Protein FMP42 n=1 Tax=Porphyridium purpureum TaxID=35688 RepID=A0A5J4Z473_PORPP|nr:Protein FMP42 [Porphyridium purpureum]|eukprot:POR3572..scf295_1
MNRQNRTVHRLDMYYTHTCHPFRVSSVKINHALASTLLHWTRFGIRPSGVMIPNGSPSAQAQRLLLFGVLLSVFCFAGTVFGWAPLQLMLLEEGQYDELCRNSARHGVEQESLAAPSYCADQLSRMHFIYTLGSFALSAVSLPAGLLLDAVGPKLTLCMSAALQVAGLVLLAYSDSLAFDAFVPAILLVACSGLLVMLASFPVSFLFRDYQPMILAAISCLFDASSLIFALAYHLRSLGRKRLLLLYAGFAAILYACLVALWHVVGEDVLSNATSASPRTQDEEQRQEKQEDRPAASFLDRLSLERQLSLRDRTVLGQLASTDFAVILVFSCCQMLRCIIYIGMCDQVLHFYHDDARTGYFYSSLFGWILPVGIVFIPLIDFTVRRFGLIFSLQMTNVLGLVYGLMTLIPVLAVQVPVFIVFTCFRAFLYGVMSTFNAWVFGYRTIGRMTGFVFSISAIVSLLQYPLVSMVNYRYGGNPFWVCLFLALVCLPLIVMIATYGKRHHIVQVTERAEVHFDDASTQPLLK